MILQVFSIFDSKVEDYAKPFYCLTKGEAVRAFSDGLQDKDSSLAKHPEDYTLFHLGEYDSSNGKFSSLPTPYSLGVGLEFV